MRAAALLLALLASGCVTRRTAPEEPPPLDPYDPITLMAGMEMDLECDHARVQVPERFRGEVVDLRGQGPGYSWSGVRLRKLSIVTREGLPVVDVGGEDFSIVAEGIVRLTRRSGMVSTEEGPFRTLVLRNGKMVAR